VLGVARAHAVRFVNDDEVPRGAPEALQHVVALRPVNRGDDLRLVLPGVHAVGVPQIDAADDIEPFPETVAQLALPLEREVRRADDEGSAHEPPQLQLLQQKPGHDRLPGTGVVGEQEANARLREYLAVDGFELVGQRINARDRQREVGVVTHRPAPDGPPRSPGGPAPERHRTAPPPA